MILEERLTGKYREIVKRFGALELEVDELLAGLSAQREQTIEKHGIGSSNTGLVKIGAGDSLASVTNEGMDTQKQNHKEESGFGGEKGCSLLHAAHTFGKLNHLERIGHGRKHMPCILEGFRPEENTGNTNRMEGNKNRQWHREKAGDIQVLRQFIHAEENAVQQTPRDKRPTGPMP